MKMNKKAIFGQTASNHYTRAIQRERGCRDESNDAAKAPVQTPKSAVCVARSQRSG
jgi:hypothetical protein